MKIIKQQCVIRHPLYKWVLGLVNDKRTLYKFVAKVIKKHKRFWRVPLGRETTNLTNYDFRKIENALEVMYEHEEIKPCNYWK